MIRLINENYMRGYLAYADDKPIGWCNANDRTNYIRLKLDMFKGIWDNRDQKTCSVVCFLIDPAWRRKGVAAGLLDRICEDYGKLGYDCVEAYPQNNPDAEYCQGPPALYRRCGFEIIKELEGFCLARTRLK